MRAARAAALLAAFAVPAIVYAASASRQPGSWDTAELQGVPYILGIPHPTGFPFYVLLGYAWSHVFAIGSVAWRMNVMSGIATAVAAAAAYGVALEFDASPFVALPATLWAAFSLNVWSHGSRAEAHDVAAACAMLAIYAFIRWMRGAGAAWFAAAFALCGLAIAAHPNALWLLPAFFIGAAIAKHRPSLRLLAGSLGLAAAGLLLYAYLPLRSQYVVARHLDPAAALPGAGGGIFWNYDDPATMHGLALELTGAQSQATSYLLASLNPAHYPAALRAAVSGLHAQYGMLALVLIAGGFVAAWRRRWRATLVLAVASIAPLVFSVVYPNESDIGRYRLLLSWLAVPLLGALTPQSKRGAAGALHAALALVLLAGAALAFDRGRGHLRHRPAEGGRWVIDAVRPYVAPGSVIVADWLDATSLAYGAYVDGSLRGRIIVSDDPLRTALYRTWAPRRRVYVLVNPHEIDAVPGARDDAALDAYHELYAVQP